MKIYTAVTVTMAFSYCKLLGNNKHCQMLERIKEVKEVHPPFLSVLLQFIFNLQGHIKPLGD